MCMLSPMRGRRPQEYHRHTTVVLDLHKVLTRLVIHKLIIKISPPLQLPKCSSHLPKYSPSHIPKFPSISPNPILSLPKCRSQLHKRAFKLQSVSPSILRPSSSLQKYLPKIQNYMPNYQTNCYPRYQAPHPNVQNYCQVPPLQGNYTTPLVLDLRKSPPKFLLHFPKDEQSCTSD